MVSIRLETVHNPTSPPAHSSQPCRASITSSATGDSGRATTGGSAVRKALTEAARSAPSPIAENIAATNTKNGNSAKIAV